MAFSPLSITDRSERAPGAGVTAVLGPTNTGKTHLAIERMLAHSSGMIGLPLRLLAREVYNKIADRAVVRGGQIVARKVMNLSITLDHRIVDGATAARFLKTVIEYLETPNLLLLEGI